MKWSYDAALLLVDYLYYSQNHTINQCNRAAENLAYCLTANSGVTEDDGTAIGYRFVLAYIQSFNVTKGDLRNICGKIDGLTKEVYLLSETKYEVFQQQVALAKEAFAFSEYGSQVEQQLSPTEPIEIDTPAEDISYSKQLGIPADAFTEMELEELDLSARGFHLLKRAGAKTVSDVLLFTPSQLMQMKGLGNGTFNEIEKKLSSLQNDMTVSKQKASFADISICKAHAAEICTGDFTWVEQEECSDLQLAVIEDYKEAYDILGADLSFKAYSHDEACMSLIEMLSAYHEEYNTILVRRNELVKELHNVPTTRWNQSSFGYLRIFARTDHEFEEAKTLSDKYPRLYDIAENSDVRDEEAYCQLLGIIKKASFNVEEELHKLMQKLFNKPRTKTIISMRSRGKTLEETGQVLHITRERVRQIEAKAKREFSYSESRRHYLLKISALRNCDDILTATELKEYFGEYYVELLYLFRAYESQAFYYDEQLDSFVIGDNSLGARIQEYIESLPDTFSDCKLAGYIDVAEEDFDIPKELLLPSIQETYKITGSTYHRSRLSLSSIYASVLQQFFPNGMHIYDDSEIDHFRHIIRELYGDIRLPDNNRSISARLGNIGILCGRGAYRSKKKQYISSELQEKIQTYIEESPSAIFLVSTLFSAFEKDLFPFGIDNKYYLQGVLRELFDNKYFIKRDYLSKDAASTSLYSDIVQFIAKSPYPISKQQIQEAYPGITDIVITIAVSDSEILNFFGEYLHASKLDISEHEKVQLKQIVENAVADGKTHHVKDIFPLVNEYNDSLLSRNSILWPFSLFSVLAYLYEDCFNFERPFIAKKGIQIGRPMEQISELVHSQDIVTLASIVDIAKEAHFSIYSYLDLLNSFNDTHLIADANGLISIERCGIDEDYAKQMELMILSEICQPTPIASLECIHRFKDVGATWSDWLIYSIMKKWATELDVAVTSKYFKQASPIIGRKGSITPDVLDAFSGIQRTEVSQVDNLDNIDDLIADYILEEWEEL